MEQIEEEEKLDPIEDSIKSVHSGIHAMPSESSFSLINA